MSEALLGFASLVGASTLACDPTPIDREPQAGMLATPTWAVLVTSFQVEIELECLGVLTLDMNELDD
jgi:hypothetical protein